MDIFVVIYYVLNYIKSIPQIIKLIRTKSAGDYSLGTICMQFIAVLSWSLYIFTSKQSTLVYIGTVADLLILIITDVLIVMYYHSGRKTNDN